MAVAAGAAPPMQRLVRSTTPSDDAAAGAYSANAAGLLSMEGAARADVYPPGRAGGGEENRRPGSRVTVCLDLSSIRV